jgi:hypothetical protein
MNLRPSGVFLLASVGQPCLQRLAGDAVALLLQVDVVSGQRHDLVDDRLRFVPGNDLIEHGSANALRHLVLRAIFSKLSLARVFSSSPSLVSNRSACDTGDSACAW